MELSQVIGSRRSIRWFKSDPIPEDHVKEILSSGIRAPTASGAEQWFFVIVKSEEKRKIFHNLVKKGQMVYLSRMLRNPLSKEELQKWERFFEEGMYYAPLYIIGLLNYNRRSLTDEYLLYEHQWGIQSVTLALGQMMLTAWSMGYGSVWIAVPQLFEEELKVELGLPSNMSYVGSIAIGKPAEMPAVRSRKALEESILVI